MKLNLPPFSIDLTTNVSTVKRNISRLYPEDVFLSNNSISDYFTSMKYSTPVRRFYKPQTLFSFENIEPFKATPVGHSYAGWEWGLNYVIANCACEYVILHSGIAAFNDKAVVFPAPPGSGKSTLSSYLQGQAGWRLLSDEMALILPMSNQVHPFVRPICLKNNSINLVKKWYPKGQFSTVAKDTTKGDVVHFSPSPQSWKQRQDLATIKTIVFPKYQTDTPFDVYKLTKTQAFMQLAENCFNLPQLGKLGFDTICHIIDEVDSYEIIYNDVEQMKDFLENEAL